MSLRVWLPLNGDLRNNGLDNITVTNNGATVDNNGKIGKCYNFDGTNDNIIGTYTATEEISFCCWVYFNTIKNGHVIDARNPASGVGYQPMYVTASSIQIGCSGSTYPSYSFTWETNTWYHICVVHNVNGGKCYVDGDLIGETSAAKGVNLGSCDFKLGSRYSNSNYSNVKLNDFRIYDHALSVKEIKEISKGLVAHYKLDGAQNNLLPGTSNLEVQYTYPASGYKDWWTKKTSIVPTASQYILSFYAKSTISGDKIRSHYYNPNTTTTCVSSQGITKTASDGNMDFTLSTEWKRYWVVYNQSETTATKTVIFPRLLSGQGTGIVSVRCVKFEEGNIATPWKPNVSNSSYSKLGFNSNVIYDSSGYNHHGSVLGTLTYTIDTARNSTSTSFNGTDSGVLIPNLDLNSIINNSATYSFWIKPNGENGARSVYFGMYSGTSWSIEKTTSNKLRSYWKGSPDETCNGTTIADDQWQHICMVKNDANSIKAYVNGELCWESTAAHATKTFSTTCRIGRDTRSGDGTPYKGLMSDFRIYATALNADDVKELYQTSASIDNNGNMFTYEFKED